MELSVNVNDVLIMAFFLVLSFPLIDCYLYAILSYTYIKNSGEKKFLWMRLKSLEKSSGSQIPVHVRKRIRRADLAFITLFFAMIKLSVLPLAVFKIFDEPKDYGNPVYSLERDELFYDAGVYGMTLIPYVWLPIYQEINKYRQSVDHETMVSWKYQDELRQCIWSGYSDLPVCVTAMEMGRALHKDDEVLSIGLKAYANMDEYQHLSKKKTVSTKCSILSHLSYGHVINGKAHKLSELQEKACQLGCQKICFKGDDSEGNTDLALHFKNTPRKKLASFLKAKDSVEKNSVEVETKKEAEVSRPYNASEKTTHEQMGGYKAEKLLENINYDINKIPSETFADDTLQNEIIAEHLDMLMGLREDKKVHQSFVKRILKSRYKGKDYFPKGYLEKNEFMDLVNEQAPYDVNREFSRVKRKLTEPDRRYLFGPRRAFMHADLFKEKKFVKFLMTYGDCHVPPETIMVPEREIEGRIVDYALQFILSKDRIDQRYACIPTVFTKDEGFLLKLVDVLPHYLNSVPKDIVNASEKLKERYLEHSSDRIFRYLKSSYYKGRSRGAGRGPDVPREAYNSHRLHEKIMNEIPRTLKDLPEQTVISDELIEKFLRSNVDPLQFFNKDSDQYDKIKRMYRSLASEIDSEALRKEIMSNTIKALRDDVQCCGTRYTPSIRKALSFASETMLNSEELLSMAFNHFRYIDNFMEAYPIEHEFSEKAKSMLLKYFKERSKFPSRSDLHPSLSSDEDFMKSYNQNQVPYKL